jgi:hypothetical protein
MTRSCSGPVPGSLSGCQSLATVMPGGMRSSPSSQPARVARSRASRGLVVLIGVDAAADLGS